MKKIFSYNNLLLLGIVALGFILRVYRYGECFNFSAELGDNLLEIRQSILDKKLPLAGPPTSHPWLRFGPLYYWFLIPIIKIFGWNPIVAGYFGLGAGLLIIVVNYRTVVRIFNKRIAQISSLLIAISPLWISFSKDARFYFLTTLFFYPCYYFLYKYLRGDKKAIIYSLFFWGIMLNFHLSPLAFTPLFICLLVQKRERLIIISSAVAAFLITQLPFLLSDFKNSLIMSRQFLLWLPYRLAGFIYLYPKNNPSLTKFTQSFNSLLEVTGKSFIFQTSWWPWVLISLAILLFFIKRENKVRLLIIFLLLNIAAIFIHGDSPAHYFLPVFPVVVIITAIYLDKLKPIVLGLLLIGIFLLNAKYYFQIPAGFINLHDFQSAVKAIADNLGQQSFSLKRIGPDAHFEKQYAQNYLYLLETRGLKPIEKGTLLITVYESEQIYSPEEAMIYNNGGNLSITMQLLQ